MPTMLGKAIGTSLGKALGLELGASSLDSQITALTPYSYVESDYYSVDGVSGKVSAFLDKVTSGTGIKAVDPTHAFAQATSANQVAVPTSDALFPGRNSASFTGSEYYDSSAAASAWKCLHDGTGFTAVFVAAANTAAASGTGHTFASSMDLEIFTTSIGSTFRFAAQTGRLSLVTARNNATATINTSFLVAGWVNDSPRYARFTYVESASPEYTVLDKGSSIGTGNSGAAPDTGNPTQTLRLFGDHGAAVNGLRAKWVSTMIWNRVLSAPDWAAVQAYILAKYGVTA